MTTVRATAETTRKREPTRTGLAADTLTRAVLDNLAYLQARYPDDYLLLADYRAYVDAQTEVERVFRDPGRWTRMSILNVARAGKFSSDGAIREYSERIWG